MKKLFILILFILGLNTFTPIVNAQADIATLVKNMGYTIDPKTIPKASIVVEQIVVQFYGKTISTYKETLLQLVKSWCCTYYMKQLKMAN